MTLFFCTLLVAFHIFDLIFFQGHKSTHVFKTRIVGADFRGTQVMFSATVFQRAVAEFEPICNNWQTRPAGRYYAIDKAQSMHFQSAVHYIRGQILELPFSLQSTYFEALLNFSYKFPQFSRYPFVTIYLTELTAQTVGILTFIL